MKLERTMRVLTAGLVLGLNSYTAQAALFDRGGGLIYDGVLNVTWLQDANYAKTSGYDADGFMNWYSATNWANSLVYGGYSDWRLASNSPVNGSSFNVNQSTDGSTDDSYNITSPYSELSYMYYVNLGLKGFLSTNGAIQADWGIFANGTLNGVDLSTYGQKDIGLVKNLQSGAYFSGTSAPNASNAWYFDSGIGRQSYGLKSAGAYAWVVRAGDVAAVPVPGAIWLFGGALVSLISVNRRKVAA